MRKVENAVQGSHDYVSCQEQTSKHEDYQKSKEMLTENIMTTSHLRILKQQRDVDQEYCDNKSFKNIETTKRSCSRKHSGRLSKTTKDAVKRQQQ